MCCVGDISQQVGKPTRLNLISFIMKHKSHDNELTTAKLEERFGVGTFDYADILQAARANGLLMFGVTGYVVAPEFR